MSVSRFMDKSSVFVRMFQSSDWKNDKTLPAPQLCQQLWWNLNCFAVQSANMSLPQLFTALWNNWKYLNNNGLTDKAVKRSVSSMLFTGVIDDMMTESEIISAGGANNSGSHFIVLALCVCVCVCVCRCVLLQWGQINYFLCFIFCF